MGLPSRGPSVSRGTEKVRALRDLLGMRPPGRLLSRALRPTGPRSRLELAAEFGEYVCRFCTAITFARLQPAAVLLVAAPVWA